MGGWGSGRPPSVHPTMDDVLVLAIRQLCQRGLFTVPLEPGHEASTVFADAGVTVSVPWRATRHPARIRLEHQVTTPDKGTTRQQWIAIAVTPCPYGGERLWFRCPRCHQRRAALVCVSRRFWCRVCHGVAYASTRETDVDRNLRGAARIQARLGGDPRGALFEPGSKPPGMHVATYARLCDELAERERRDLVWAVARFGPEEPQAEER